MEAGVEPPLSQMERGYGRMWLRDAGCTGTGLSIGSCRARCWCRSWCASALGEAPIRMRLQTTQTSI
jgi:hypothetical protein